jgi:surface polysaccharide O-acyltransferase-like enzyme
MGESEPRRVIRNRNVAIAAVALTAILWVSGTLRFFLSVRPRPWHFLDALGNFSWLGYVLIGLFLLGFTLGMIWFTRGLERLLSASLGFGLLLIPAEHLFAGLTLVFVQYFAEAARTAMLIVVVLILRDRWTADQSVPAGDRLNDGT